MAEAGKEDVDKAVRAARKAFDEGPWPRMTAKERGRWACGRAPGAVLGVLGPGARDLSLRGRALPASHSSLLPLLLQQRLWSDCALPEVPTRRDFLIVALQR